MIMSGRDLISPGLSTSPSPDRYQKAPIRDETRQNELLQTHNSGALVRIPLRLSAEGR